MSAKRATVFVFLFQIFIYASSQLVVQNDPYSNFYSFAAPDRQVSFHRNLQPVPNFFQRHQPQIFPNNVQQQVVKSQPAFGYNPPIVAQPHNIAYNSQPNFEYNPQHNIDYNAQPNVRNVAPIMHETMIQRPQPAANEPIPIKFSQSSDVSSVRFSSNGLNYNF